MSLTAKEWRTARAIQCIWGLIDKDKIEENEEWLLEQENKKNYKLVFHWCYDQLEEKEQIAIMNWITGQIGANEVNSGILEGYEEKYREGDHNLHAWLAIDYCSENKLPLPVWVIEYLSSTASEMLNKDPVKKTGPQKVFKAVGIKAVEFSSFHKRSRDLDICSKIEQLLEEPWGPQKQRRTVTRARKDAAQTENVGFDTVEKTHKKLHGHRFYKFLLSHHRVKNT